MKDADLIQKADSMLLTASHDITELSAYGITPEWLQTVKDQRDEFINFPDDIEDVGYIAEKFEEKKKTRIQVQLMVSANNARLKNKREECKEAFHKGFVENPARLTDSMLFRQARRQARAMHDFVTDLSSEGVTQASIDLLNAKNQLFADAMVETETALDARIDNTEQRIEKGNALYKSIQRISSYGLSAFATVSAAHAKPYYLTQFSAPKTFSLVIELKKAEKKELPFTSLPEETRMSVTHVEGEKTSFRFGSAGMLWELKSKKRLVQKLKQWGYTKTENNILYIENTSAKRAGKIRLRLPVEVKEAVIQLTIDN